MEYYDKDGELVKLSASNVWDVEEIPSFMFEIENRGVKAQSEAFSGIEIVTCFCISLLLVKIFFFRSKDRHPE